MASYKNYYSLTVTLIVFYFIINLDNAKCPTPEDIKQCKEHMNLICGDYLKSALNCARVAIRLVIPRKNPGEIFQFCAFHNSPPIDANYEQIPVPDCVTRYFADFVTPSISTLKVPNLDNFCRSREALNNPSVFPVVAPYVQQKYPPRLLMNILIEACNEDMQFLRGHSIEDLLFKNDAEKFCNSQFAIIYVNEYSTKIELKENITEEPLSPENYCDTYGLN